MQKFDQYNNMYIQLTTILPLLGLKFGLAVSIFTWHLAIFTKLDFYKMKACVPLQYISIAVIINKSQLKEQGIKTFVAKTFSYVCNNIPYLFVLKPGSYTRWGSNICQVLQQNK